MNFVSNVRDVFPHTPTVKLSHLTEIRDISLHSRISAVIIDTKFQLFDLSLYNINSIFFFASKCIHLVIKNCQVQLLDEGFVGG